MAKQIMGRDISTISAEEMKELMAKMRSCRSGTNGRKGKKNNNPRHLENNDFPLDNPSPEARGKYRNEHVKAVFVTTRELYKSAYKGTPIYIFAFLTDSNKYAFYEFKDYVASNCKLARDGSTYRIKRFQTMFSSKNIDNETYFVVNASYIKMTSFVYTQMSVISKFSGAKIKWVPNSEMIRKLIREYKIFKNKTVYNNCHKYGKKQIDKVFADIYDFVVENKLCPWINEESLAEVNSLFKYKRHSYVVAELGLFYAVLRKFDAFMCRKKGKFGKWLQP